MPAFLITLTSKVSKKSGIGLFDTKKGFIYLQVFQHDADDFSYSSYRGIATFKQNIFLLTAHNIFLYTYQNQPDEPLFIPSRTIEFYDWPMTDGRSPYMGLGTILCSIKRNRIFVANNARCAVDEISMTGQFIRRHHLWEIAPDIFISPTEPKAGFTYGLIRQLCELPNGSMYMTVANCNATKSGKIIDFETGKLVLDGLHDPHAGLASDDLFFLLDTASKQNKATPRNTLIAYALNAEKPGTLKKNIWATRAQSDTDAKITDVHLQGMIVVDDTIYCNASVVAGPDKETNFIFTFDRATGQQLESFTLPDLEDFRKPQVRAMSRLPANLPLKNSDTTLRYFVNGKQGIAKPYIHPDKVSKSTPEQRSDQSSSQNQQKAALQQHQKATPAPCSVLIDNISLCYRRTGEFLFSFSKKQRKGMKFWALRDVSASFYEGETIGLIGRNGSGKSTLSMIISGALKPDKGKIIINGKVQLLALGIGFRPQLTGRENVMISGAILGMSRKDIKSQLPDIEEFAELGDFFDEPIRTYSAGMKSRLGFAVSTAVEPDILILDEVMSTGDAAFRKKANKRMEKMRAKTKTVIIVSHNPGQVRELCTRVIWLERGRLIMDGSTEDILPIYEKFCQNPKKWLKNHPDKAALLADL